MEIELIRYKITPYSIGGKLTLTGIFECYTLERAYMDTDFQPIPMGRYEIQLSFSPHFKRIIPHVLNVPGRSAIEIHTGNRPQDTHGCILVGQQLGENTIWASELALNMLCEKLEQYKEQIFLTIKENNNDEKMVV